MREAIILRVMGEAAARQMLQSGVPFSACEQWLLEWEFAVSRSSFSTSSVEVVARQLFNMLQTASQITDQSDGNGE